MKFQNQLCSFGGEQALIVKRPRKMPFLRNLKKERFLHGCFGLFTGLCLRGIHGKGRISTPKKWKFEGSNFFKMDSRGRVLLFLDPFLSSKGCRKVGTCLPEAKTINLLYHEELLRALSSQLCFSETSPATDHTFTQITLVFR